MRTLFVSILLFSSLSFAGDIYELNCVNNNSYTDLGTAKIELNTFVIVNSENDYSIEEGNFSFYIEDAWTDQNVEIKKTDNFANYNPRKYKGHAKFPRIGGRYFYGFVDFLAPHSALLNGEKKV